MKTKKNFLFGLSIAILLLFSGCQDDFDDLYYDYVGFWDSEKYVLQIWCIFIKKRQVRVLRLG